MPDYFVFGDCLRSELPFPELAESRGREPKWTLKLASLPSDAGGELLSDSQLSSTCRIRISRCNGRLRFFHSCAGTFELSPDGSEILFDAERAADTNAARSDLVARLLLMCANHEDVTWLHASAVRVGESAIAFVGPSGAGKSTLAVALAKAGAKHICDDALPIEKGDPPMVWASDHIIRLRSDSKWRLASQAEAVRRESDGKFVVTHDAIRSGAARDGSPLSAESRAPLAALYLLAPFAPQPSQTSEALITRRLIPPRVALPLLIQHLKLGAMVRPEYPASTMQQLGAIVASVPVFELKIARSWSVIDASVAQIIDWHGETVLPAVRAAGSRALS
jgi:energy-coupling factor transporter ATP-binding protein EcfA2